MTQLFFREKGCNKIKIYLPFTINSISVFYIYNIYTYIQQHNFYTPCKGTMVDDLLKRLDVNVLLFLVSIFAHVRALNIPQSKRTPEAQSFYAAAKNKGPILKVLIPITEACRKEAGQYLNILEIASGTGEHAAYFCSSIPRVVYQPSSLDAEMESKWRALYNKEKVPTMGPPYSIETSLQGWVHQSTDALTSANSKILRPLYIDVMNFDPSTLRNEVKAGDVDVLICINMVHIAPIACTEGLFQVGRNSLRKGGVVYLYGPYMVNGFMVESNQVFDRSLRDRNFEWGVRSVEEVTVIAQKYGFNLEQTFEMPSNNLSVIFRKL